MKKFLKWIGIGLIAIVVIAIIAGAGKSKDNQDSGSNGSNSKQEESQEAIKVSARDLADEFDENQVAAEDKWEGKLVEFSAEITNITDSGLSFANVASKEFSMAQISCRIKDKEQLMPLKNGQTVTVRGVVGTQTLGVIGVSNCEVVQ